MIIAKARLQKIKNGRDMVLLTVPQSANIAVGTYCRIVPIYDRSDLDD